MFQIQKSVAATVATAAPTARYEAPSLGRRAGIALSADGTGIAAEMDHADQSIASKTRPSLF